jgi:sodium/potassium-transporting ATPase subunit beta
MSADDENSAKGGKKSGRQKLRDCCTFLYNSDKGEVLGRTGKSWGLILLFYAVYYGLLAGFFAICLLGFFKTMDDNAPTQQNMYSLLKQNPGMGFRPKPDISSTLIKFNAHEQKTYEKYLRNINETLKPYTTKTDGVVHADCTDLSPGSLSGDEVCDFPLSMLGSNCTYENQYGYAEGKPCVILKINKVYNWSPVPFENGSDAEIAATKELEERRDDDYIGVNCVGEIDADGNSINQVTYYPPKGFPSIFFPYRRQPGYLAPVVMAQFDVVPGRLVMVWCRVWAKNIKHHRVDLQGSVHFELLVDIPPEKSP